MRQLSQTPAVIAGLLTGAIIDGCDPTGGDPGLYGEPTVIEDPSTGDAAVDLWKLTPGSTIDRQSVVLHSPEPPPVALPEVSLEAVTEVDGVVLSHVSTVLVGGRTHVILELVGSARQEARTDLGSDIAWLPSVGRSCLLLEGDQLVPDTTGVLLPIVPRRPNYDTSCLNALQVLVDGDSVIKMLAGIYEENTDQLGRLRHFSAWAGALVHGSGGAIEQRTTGGTVVEVDRDPQPGQVGPISSGGLAIARVLDDGRVIMADSGQGMIAAFNGVNHSLIYDGWVRELRLGGDAPTPLLVARPESLSLTADNEGQHHFVTRSNGRIEELVLDEDGVRYRGRGRVRLPDGHQLTGATWVGGDRFLVVTTSGYKGDGVRYYREPPATDLDAQPEWGVHLDVGPDNGTSHIWLAELPAASEQTTRLPPISETVELTVEGQHLRVCYPPAYGPLSREGWTLAGFPAEQVLSDGEGCYLIVRHPAHVEVTNRSGVYYAEGELPGVGRATLTTASAGTTSWTTASCHNTGFSETVTTITTSPERYYAPPTSGDDGYSIHGRGLNLRQDPANLGIYWWSRDGYRIANSDGQRCTPGTEEAGIPCPLMAYEHAGCNVNGGVGGQWPVGLVHTGPMSVEYVEHVEEEPFDEIRSSGVQTGGMMNRYFVARQFPHSTGGGPEPDIALIQTPDGATGDDWIPEMTLADWTVCGSIGDDRLYCRERDGTQREIAGVEDVSPGHWWVMAPEVQGGDCLVRQSATDGTCGNGVGWLLGASAERPAFDRLDPETMTLETFDFDELLPAFPAAVSDLRVAVSYVQYRAAALVSVLSPESDDPLHWFVALGPIGDPQVLEGPVALPFEDHWNINEPLPLLRIIAQPDGLQPAISVIHPVYGFIR